MKTLNAALLKKFLKLASDSLDGNWLLIGGTLLPAVGIDIRATIDIDLVGLSEKETKQSLELMTIAEKLGLGVEVINQAAAFFVHKIGYKKSDLIALQKGTSATIFRPSLSLYWKLKLSRLTESDAIDCQHYLSYCRGQNDPIDVRELKTILRIHSNGASVSLEKSKRISHLKSLLS